MSREKTHILATSPAIVQIILIALIVMPFRAQTQTNDSTLLRPISVSLNKTTLYQALNTIGEVAGCFFIYDNADVQGEKKIQPFQAKDTPLIEILNKLLGSPPMSFRIIDKHILIYQKQNANGEKEIPEVDTTDFIIIKGRVFDKDEKSAIPFATIAISQLGLGTITNFDGIFSLRIPKHYQNGSIVVSHLGYENLIVPIAILQDKTYSLYIKPRYIAIQEVFIRNIDAREIVKSAIANRHVTHCANGFYITGFYREGVKRSNNYLSYTEAVVKTLKSGYSRNSDFDQVKLLKMRKMELPDRRDTLIVKLKAGIKGSLELDILKSLPDFLDPKYMDNYVYTKTDIVAHDTRSAYAISFEQHPDIEQPMYTGTLYVDIEQLALIAAEFEINPKYVARSANLFVQKKNRKVSVKPESVKYQVKYRNWEGKYYIHHVRGDLTMRVKERRKLFGHTFSLFLEYASMEIDTNNVQRLTRRESIKPSIVLSEANFIYDATFWNNLNIVNPEEDISQALNRIKPRIESINNEQ